MKGLRPKILNGNFPDKKAATADSFAALKIAGLIPPLLPDSKANSRPGYERVSIGKNCHVCDFDQSTGIEILYPRSGVVREYAIGTFIFGGLN